MNSVFGEWVAYTKAALCSVLYNVMTYNKLKQMKCVLHSYEYR